MSMETSIVYGYGFDTTGITENAVIKFIKNHLETVLKLKMHNAKDEKLARNRIREAFDAVTMTDLMTADMDTFEDMCNLFPEITGSLSPLTDDVELKQFRDIVARIIYYETWIGVQYESAYQEECRGCPSIVLPQAMPWEYNETEKALTPESFEEAMRPYLEELWTEDSPLEDILIEYYG